MAFGRVTKFSKRGKTRYLVEWVDAFGTRKTRTFDSLAAATAKQSEVNARGKTSSAPGVYARCLAEYATRWLESNRTVWAPRTWRSYSDALTLHVLPFELPRRKTLGQLAMDDVTRDHAKALVVAKRSAGYAPDSVRIMFAAFRAMLNEAVEDSVIAYNPIAIAGKSIRKQIAPDTDVVVKAMTDKQLAAFLRAAESSRLYPLFLAGADQGLRLGELRAWSFDHLNLERGEAVVAVSLSEYGQRLGPTKGRQARTVELTTRVRAALAKLIAARPALALEHGWRPVPGWLFVTRRGTPFGQRNVLKEFGAVLKRAKLDGWDFTPHSLRHTFACLHLQHAKDRNVIQWVQQQLGHSSIKVTVDRYGAAIRLHDPAAADRLELLCGLHDAANGAAKGS